MIQMNTENSVKLDGSCDILQNSQAMVRRTLNWWQSTGDNLPPMRLGRKQWISGEKGTMGNMVNGNDR